MRKWLERVIVPIVLVMVVAPSQGQVIDFETKPDGSTPTDDEPLDRNTPYLVDGIELLIGFDEDGDGIVETDGVFEAVGEDGTDSFVNGALGSNDIADPGFEDQLASWFLRSPNTIPNLLDPGVLVLGYSAPVTAMSGEIWDIDGQPVVGTEAWEVRAVDATGVVVATVLSPEFDHDGPTSLDGEPWVFSVEVPDGFVRIEIDFVGTKEINIGFAFNNYSATTAASGPRLLCHDPSTPDHVVSTPGGIDSVRLIWSEGVSVDETDVEILDSSDRQVPFTLSGSDTQVTTLELGQPLVGDTFTFIVHDTAVATANNAPIDGDDDGVAGGDAVFTLTHRCEADVNGDGIIDPLDSGFVMARFGKCS